MTCNADLAAPQFPLAAWSWCWQSLYAPRLTTRHGLSERVDPQRRQSTPRARPEDWFGEILLLLWLCRLLPMLMQKGGT